MKLTGIVATGLAFILILVSSVAWVFRQDEHPRRFGEVLPGKIYRSGQPSGAQLKLLQEQIGMKAIISLRSEEECETDERCKEEAEFARKEGVSLFVIPLHDPPLDEDLRAVMNVLDDEKNYPVLIHCEHGKERTGVAVAVYRMERMGWTTGQALIEMLDAAERGKLKFLNIHDNARFVAGYRPRFALAQKAAASSTSPQ